VMNFVLRAEESMPGVQDESVKAILEYVRVEEPEDDARKYSCHGVWEEMRGDADEDRAGQKGSDEVVSLGPQSPSFVERPDFAVGRHFRAKLTRSMRAFKPVRVQFRVLAAALCRRPRTTSNESKAVSKRIAVPGSGVFTTGAFGDDGDPVGG